MTPRPIWRLAPEDAAHMRACADDALAEARTIEDEHLGDRFSATTGPLVEAIRTLVNIVEGQGEAIRQLRDYKADGAP